MWFNIEWLQLISVISWNHLSVALNRFFFAKENTDKFFSVSPYIEHAVSRNFKTFWKCNFLLKLVREVVVCINGMTFIFITYSFYFNYFYFILLLQKSLLVQRRVGRGEVGRQRPPVLRPRLHWACMGRSYFYNKRC